VYLIQDIFIPFRIISTGTSATLYTRLETLSISWSNWWAYV